MAQKSPRLHPPRELGEGGIEYSKIACDQCHRCKLKCSRELPRCERCQSINSACTFSTGKPIGKPKGSKNKTSKHAREAAEAAAKARKEVEIAALTPDQPLPQGNIDVEQLFTDSSACPPDLIYPRYNEPMNVDQQGYFNSHSRSPPSIPSPMLAALRDTDWSAHGPDALITPLSEVFEDPLDPKLPFHQPDQIHAAEWRAAELSPGPKPDCLCNPGVAVGLADSLQEASTSLGTTHGPLNQDLPDAVHTTFPAPMPLDERLTILRACSEACECSLSCATCQSRGALSRLPSVFLLEAVVDGYTSLLDATRSATAFMGSSSQEVQQPNSILSSGGVSVGELEIEHEAAPAVVRAVIVSEMAKAQNILASLRPRSFRGDTNKVRVAGAALAGPLSVLEDQMRAGV